MTPDELERDRIRRNVAAARIRAAQIRADGLAEMRARRARLEAPGLEEHAGGQLRIAAAGDQLSVLPLADEGIPSQPVETEAARLAAALRAEIGLRRELEPTVAARDAYEGKTAGLEQALHIIEKETT